MAKSSFGGEVAPASLFEIDIAFSQPIYRPVIYAGFAAVKR